MDDRERLNLRTPKANVHLVDFNPEVGCKQAVETALNDAAEPMVSLRYSSIPTCREINDADLRSLDCARSHLILISFLAGKATAVRKLLRSLLGAHLMPPIMALTDAEAGAGSINDFLMEGISEFAFIPLRPVGFRLRLKRLLGSHRAENNSVQVLKEALGMRSFIGESEAVLEQLRRLPSFARSDANVLITGESGTGKEAIARAMHHLSPRAGGPFVPVNCGSIPPELIQNELFGHEAGAFTDAKKPSPGLAQSAHRGTLFLDEVDTLSPQAQISLLRVLQEGECRRVGSERTIKVDVRVVAASNADVVGAVRAGRIREDFYYRLNVLSVHLPPLRERHGDIMLLANHFLQQHCDKAGNRFAGFSPGACSRLIGHTWPGNVRELQNVVERAAALAGGRIIEASDITIGSVAAPKQSLSFHHQKRQVVSEFERRYLLEMLAAHNGNISMAARAACKNRRAFWELLRKHNLQPAGKGSDQLRQAALR